MRATYNYNVMGYTREVLFACIKSCTGRLGSFCYAGDAEKDSVLVKAIQQLKYNRGTIVNRDLYATVDMKNKIKINVFKSSKIDCYICFNFDGAYVCVLVSRKEAREVLLKLLKSLGRTYVG